MDGFRFQPGEIEVRPLTPCAWVIEVRGGQRYRLVGPEARALARGLEALPGLAHAARAVLDADTPTARDGAILELRRALAGGAEPLTAEDRGFMAKFSGNPAWEEEDHGQGGVEQPGPAERGSVLDRAG